MSSIRPIGIFDSGYGGLTVFKSIQNLLPQYDYLYLGDNARAPYGNRSLETVYEYTLEAVWYLFSLGCPLVIIACNTASAEALRNIQQKNLPVDFPDRRVLGVIRPTAEIIGSFSKTGSIGLLGTKGTVRSESYLIEIDHFFPEIKVYQQSCPLWVPAIESGNYRTEAMNLIIKADIDLLLAQSEEIDTVLLACTHYPLVENQIRQFLPAHTTLVSQGDIVADRLQWYLTAHPDIDEKITSSGKVTFLTTDDTEDFNQHGLEFFGTEIRSERVELKKITEFRMNRF